jgi:hypothetical protein
MSHSGPRGAANLAAMRARIPLMLRTRLRLAPWWLARQPARRPWHAVMAVIVLGAAIAIAVNPAGPRSPACPWRVVMARDAAAAGRSALARVCPSPPGRVQAGP